MTRPAWRFTIAHCALFTLCVLLVCMAAHPALAQPFGMHREGPPQLGPIAGWILAEQAKFYLMLSHTIREAKSNGNAAYTLLGISFIYGVFHAAGPGHGKAVISSYMVANNETWRRGVALSFAAAILQALTAIAIVGIAAVLLGATAKVMGNTVRVIEEVSYGLIILIGLRLLWVKGRSFLHLLRSRKSEHHEHDHAHAHDHAHDHRSHDHEHGHSHEHGHDHDHHHAHGHGHHHHGEEEASAWGHAHAPEPSELGGKHWLRRGLAAIFAVGLRPCSGAIIVLVFALAQGLFWIGVASTFVMGLGTAITVTAVATIAVSARGLAGRLAGSRPGSALLIVRGLETGAAVAIILFGVALLTGYMMSERMGLF
ncbi:MAG TPA: nickel/cobalt transporter [Pseudolabrys sp.]|jgi:nickel/cobalt exporter|nr:nickel/cobalt transporter [Pseudolabrys sp.]